MRFAERLTHIAHGRAFRERRRCDEVEIVVGERGLGFGAEFASHRFAECACDRRGEDLDALRPAVERSLLGIDGGEGGNLAVLNGCNAESSVFADRAELLEIALEAAIVAIVGARVVAETHLPLREQVDDHRHLARDARTRFICRALRVSRRERGGGVGVRCARGHF